MILRFLLELLDVAALEMMVLAMGRPGVPANKSPFMVLSADLDKSTYTVINLSLPIQEAAKGMLLFQLDLKGIACSQGSACQSGSQKGSFVLNAIYGDEKMKVPSLRFSLSHYNTKDEIDYVVGVLKEYMEKQTVFV